LRTVYINGKFTAQPTTGVQRVAGCLVAALDACLAQANPNRTTRWVLLCPPSGLKPHLERIEVRTLGPRWAKLAVWEQAFLPMACRGSVLVCLSGSAPAFKAQQVCMIHDAAVFDTPEVYRPVFVAWYRFLFRRLARSTAAIVITVSEHSRQRLALGLKVSPDRLAVVHNGADHLLACEADHTIVDRLRLRAGRYFLVVGTFSSNKNWQTSCVRFCPWHNNDDVQLVLVGDTNESVFAADPVIAGDRRVVRAGRVTDGELKALYAAATALVFASRSEGFGLPPLEAMSCGCPVIASKRAAIPEVCGDAAVYIDPDNADDVADAMHRLLADTSLAERLRRDGASRAREFTWHGAARALLSRMAGAHLIDAPKP
jgi:glycosyltransferase involved in cell wall biosynthesis